MKNINSNNYDHRAWSKGGKQPKLIVPVKKEIGANGKWNVALYTEGKFNPKSKHKSNIVSSNQWEMEMLFRKLKNKK